MRTKAIFFLLCCSLVSIPAGAAAEAACPWRAASTPDEQRLDAQAFEGLDRLIGERAADVQSVVAVQQVHPPLGVVVAATSSMSPGSQQRGQAMRLIRAPLFQALQKRGQAGCAH